VSLSVQPPRGQVTLGDLLGLRCEVAMGTGPLSFSWQLGGLGTILDNIPHLEWQHIGDNDNGHYQCWISDGDSVAKSPTVNVTVL
ncbi:FCRL1 protein, partial [Catharus fuscescens]|nr:FCRL1 protein [Catharus fuscescens]